MEKVQSISSNARALMVVFALFSSAGIPPLYILSNTVIISTM
jgi:hypothetical protein